MNVWLASNITAIALAFGLTALSRVPPVTADDMKVRRVGSAIGGAGLVSTFFWLIAWAWVWLVFQ